MTLAPSRNFTALQRGTITPASFASLSAFSYAFWVRFTAPLTAGRIIRIGDVTDPASFAVEVRVATAVEETFTQTNCIILARRHRTATALGTVDRLASTSNTASAGAWMHLIASFRNGDHAQLYINGILQVMTALDPVLPAGAPRVTSTDELSIGDPTTDARPGFVGDIGRVTLLPSATGPTAAMVMYRHQSDPLRWIGRGSKDALAATNHSPVAVPLQAAAQSGSPATINPRTVAFDQDGNTVSIVTGSATANPGSVAISSGNLVYTPPTSFVGTGLLGYNLRDTAGLTSVGRVDVTVTSAPDPGLDIPDTATNVFLSSSGDLGTNLSNAYAAAGADTTIWLPAGTYNRPGGGTWPFNKTSASSSSPIIIRPNGNNWLTPLFTNRVLVSGNDHVFAGILFPASLSAPMKITGNRSRITRCKSNYTGTTGSVAIEITGGADIRVDHNDISNKNGSGNKTSKDMCIRCSHTNGLPTRPIIERNWIHDCDGRNPNNTATGNNGYEGIQVGEGAGDGSTFVRAIVRYNLLERVTNESETISIKSSGSTMTNNIARNCKSMTSRSGHDNIWIACRSESSSGFEVWQDKHFYIGCSGTISMSEGNTSVAAYADGAGHSQPTNRPAAEDVKVYHHTGRVEIAGGSVGNFPPRNNTIQSNSAATIVFLSNNHVNIVVTGTAPGTKPTIENLIGGGANTPGVNVGPFAP